MSTRDSLLDISQVQIDNEDKKRPRIVLAQSGSPIVLQGQAKEGDLIVEDKAIQSIHIHYIAYKHLYFVNANKELNAPLVEVVSFSDNKKTNQIYWDSDHGKYIDTNNPKHKISESYELYALGYSAGKYKPFAISFRGTSIPIIRNLLNEVAKGNLLFKLSSKINNNGIHQFAVYTTDVVDIDKLSETEYNELISHKEEVQQYIQSFQTKQIGVKKEDPVAIQM